MGRGGIEEGRGGEGRGRQRNGEGRREHTIMPRSTACMTGLLVDCYRNKLLVSPCVCMDMMAGDSWTNHLGRHLG